MIMISNVYLFERRASNDEIRRQVLGTVCMFWFGVTVQLQKTIRDLFARRLKWYVR